MDNRHKTVEIDPAEFAGGVPSDVDTGERIFYESDVLEFLIDAMNDDGIDIAMINHDHELAIEYRGKRDCFSMSISALDEPERAVIEGMAEISYIINDREGLESWTAYMYGKHTLHIMRKTDQWTAINEVREAEDNIEAE